MRFPDMWLRNLSRWWPFTKSSNPKREECQYIIHLPTRTVTLKIAQYISILWCTYEHPGRSIPGEEAAPCIRAWCRGIGLTRCVCLILREFSLRWRSCILDSYCMEGHGLRPSPGRRGFHPRNRHFSEDVAMCQRWRAACTSDLLTVLTKSDERGIFNLGMNDEYAEIQCWGIYLSCWRTPCVDRHVKKID